MHLSGIMIIIYWYISICLTGTLTCVLLVLLKYKSLTGILVLAVYQMCITRVLICDLLVYFLMFCSLEIKQIEKCPMGTLTKTGR